MNTDLVKQAVARLREKVDGGDDHDIDAGMVYGPAMREAIGMLESYLRLRAAADGAAADRQRKAERDEAATRERWWAMMRAMGVVGR